MDPYSFGRYRRLAIECLLAANEAADPSSAHALRLQAAEFLRRADAGEPLCDPEPAAQKDAA